MKYPLDLGKEMNMPETADSGIGLRTKSEMFYPTLHLEWDKPYNFPESGEMTVKFKKSSETTSKHGDKEHQSVSLDIISIESTKGEYSPTVEEPGDRIDKLRKQVEELAEESGEGY